MIVSNSAGPVPSQPAFLYIDSDADGLPDSWEIAHFGNLNQTATGDPDGDGVNNLQEYLDGTDPTNAVSVLYRIALLNDGGKVVVVPNQPAYTNGQVVTLTATGTNAVPFHAWTGDVATRSNSITVTVTTNLNLFAHFLPFTFTWTNVVAGDWSVGANWTPNLAPGSNESVVIAVPVMVTLNSNVDLLDFTLGGGYVGPELTGTGRLTIAGAGTWLGGTMSGTGSTIVLPGASFTIANANQISLVNRTFENKAATTWLTGGNCVMNGGVFTNNVGAQFQLLAPSSLTYAGGVPRFDNAGIFLTAPNGTSAFNGVAFDNYGTANILGGTLSLSGGGIDAGIITVPAGTTLDFGGGIFTSSGDPSITGAGTLMVNFGQGTLAGLINVTGTNLFSNGSMDFTGNYICTNNTMIISGGTFDFDGTGVVVPMVLNLNGTLGGAQNVTVGSAMTWTGGAMSGTGQTIIPPGATLTVDAPTFVSLTSRTLDNGGTTTWSVPNLSLNAGVITNEPGALFQVQSPSAFNYGGGSPRFDNAGTLRTTGTGTTTIGVAMNNFNTVDIQGGTLTLSAGGAHTGTMTVPGGTTLNFGGGVFTSSVGSSITGAGTLMVNFGQGTLAGTVNVTGSNIFNNGSMDFTGNYICTNNTMVISGGTMSFDGTGVVAPAILNLYGTLGGAQDVTVGSAMNWTGGSMNGSGRTVIAPGATLTIANPAFMTINNRTLENGGTTLWTGAGTINANAAVITNRVGALFNAQNASSIYFGGGAPRFDNAGTFRKSINTGTTTIGVSFTDYGTVDIQGGFLAASGGYASSSNAVLNCALSGTKPGTNYGQLQVSGSVTLNGNLSVKLANGFIPAVNDSFTVLTAGTRNGTFASFSYPSNEVTMQLSNAVDSVIVSVSAVLVVPLPILHIEGITPTTARLYWSTNYPSFHLEYNTSLGTTNWAASALAPVVTGTNYVVTNSLFGAQKYYRLSLLPSTFSPPPPALAIQVASPNAVRLLWPAEDDRTFTLQSNTNLATTNWETVSPLPVILGSNNVVTNSTIGTQRFYRLATP